MSIMIKLFLVLYLLTVALVTIVSVIWFLTAVFKLEMRTQKALLTKFYNNKSASN